MIKIIPVALVAMLSCISFAAAADHVWVQVRFVANNAAAPTTQPSATAAPAMIDSRFSAEVSEPFDIRCNSDRKMFAAEGKIERRDDGQYRMRIHLTRSEHNATQSQLVDIAGVQTVIDVVPDNEVRLAGMNGQGVWFTRISKVDPQAAAEASK